MRIGVDIISGEKDPLELVEGALDALQQERDITVVLIGPRDTYEHLLEKIQQRKRYPDHIMGRLDFLHATEVVTMEDDPLNVMKQKKDASIYVGLRAHKEGQLDAFFSPGNTGAIVVAAALILGRVKGVKKPALATFMPNIKGEANILLDVGASAECEPSDYVKFCVMGEIYSREMLGIAKPRIGLLNIGEEEHKGTKEMKDIHRFLKDLPLNFVGNVEGGDIFGTKADVIVCDGYIGNIALKTAEGAAKAISKLLKEALKKRPLALLSIPFYKGAIDELKEKIDPEKYGGAPLLGVNGNVYIGHGTSGKEAICYGIKAAARAVRHQVLSKIHTELEEFHLI
ncbi:MAG: phosphate acyltransferase PlsX [Brevinematales bacterium]